MTPPAPLLSSFARWRRPAILSAALLLWMVPAVFYTVRLWGRSYDDFYITYRYAQNLALGRGFVFNPGERVFGTTAPGFGLALGILSWLTGVDIPGLGTAATGLALLVIALLLRDAARPPEALAAGTLLLTCSFIWAQHGSEIPAALALLLGAAALAGEAPLAAGLLAGLAVWCRPDTLLGVGVLGLLLWRERRRLPWRYGLTAGAVIAAGLAAARLWFGRFLPLTLEAKRLQATIRPQTWRSGWDFWSEGLRHVHNLYAGDRTLPLVAAGILGLWPLLRHGGRTGRLLGLYAVAIAIAYPLLGVPAYTWYPIPVIIALLYGACFLAGELGRRFAALAFRGRREAGVALLLSVFLLAPLFFPILQNTWRNARRPALFPRHTLYQRTGRWIRAHSSPSDDIAYVEVGTLAYFSDRPVRDLLGLVTPESLSFVAQGDLLGAFRAHPTTFLIHHQRLHGFTDPILQRRWFRRAYEAVHEEAMRVRDERLTVYQRKLNSLEAPR